MRIALIENHVRSQPQSHNSRTGSYTHAVKWLRRSIVPPPPAPIYRLSSRDRRANWREEYCTGACACHQGCDYTQTCDTADCTESSDPDRNSGISMLSRSKKRPRGLDLGSQPSGSDASASGTAGPAKPSKRLCSPSFLTPTLSKLAGAATGMAMSPASGSSFFDLDLLESGVAKEVVHPNVLAYVLLEQLRTCAALTSRALLTCAHFDGLLMAVLWTTMLAGRTAM